MQKEPTSPPDKTLADSAHAVAKAAVVAGATVLAAMAPAFAAPAALLPELFQLVVTPPLERRRNAFLQEVHERLLAVEGGTSLQELAINPVFISTVVQATQVAVRTHRRTKLDALRNCVVNTAIAKGADERKVEYFVAAAGDMSDVHIAALKIARVTSHATSNAVLTKVGFNQMPSMVERVCKMLDLSANEHPMARKAWSDLQTLGLVTEWSASNPVVDQDLAAKHGELLPPILQPLGIEFLEFITEPVVQQNA
jgi:hypothetical protein